MKQTINEFKDFYNQELKRLENTEYLEHQKKLYANTGKSYVNFFKAHSFLLFSIFILIMSVVVIDLIYSFLYALGYKFIPIIMDLYLKISDFFEVAFFAALYGEFISDLIKYCINKSIEYHPTKRGYRFIFFAILNFIVGGILFFLLVDAVKSVDYPKYYITYLGNMILLILEATICYSISMFSRFYHDLNTTNLIGKYVKDQKTGQNVFVPTCYFYGSQELFIKHKFSSIDFNPDAVRNILYSYNEYYNGNEKSDNLYIIPGKMKKRIFTYDGAFVFIDTIHKQFKPCPNDKKITFNLNNYPNVQEMPLLWFYSYEK